MDRLAGLAVFVGAVEDGSLAAAARRLGMTPATAGKHVAAIEASLGTRLLHRTTRRLHLTEAGQAYYRSSRQILDALDEADRQARDTGDEPRGTLRLTAPTTFGALQLGAPVAAFLRRYPAVSVEMSLDDRFVDLVAGGFDLAIRIGDMPDSSLIARRIAATRMIACAAPAYLDARGRPGSVAELGRLDRLAFSGARSAGDWRFTDAGGRAETVDGKVRLRGDNLAVLLAAALDGAGVVFGPEFVLGAAVRSGALERVLPAHGTESLGIHAVRPSARLVGAKVRRFVALLEEWFGREVDWVDIASSAVGSVTSG